MCIIFVIVLTCEHSHYRDCKIILLIPTIFLDECVIKIVLNENNIKGGSVPKSIRRHQNSTQTSTITGTNVFDIDENNSHDKDNTPVSNAHHQTFEVTI